MSTSILRWVDDLGENDFALTGPKMARLGTLRRIGLAVPDGFAVTAETFRNFLAETHLEAQISAQLDLLTDPNDLAAAESVSNAIRTKIESTPINPSVAAVLREAYEELCFRHSEIDMPVAVRSSATGEDAANASFAGQYESYLGIIGGDDVINSVRKAWSSLFAARAITYRKWQNQHFKDTPMAVGVIRLIHARCAGVAFSAHPVTRKRDRIVVEGSWGWGEAVVQGVVQADHIEMDKETGRVIEYVNADKKIVSTFDHTARGVIERDMPQRFRNAPCLTDAMLSELWETVGKVEKHYGQPVDLEWVFDRHWTPGQPVSVVQTRPITTMGDESEAPAAPKWDPLNYASRYGLGIPQPTKN